MFMKHEESLMWEINNKGVNAVYLYELGLCVFRVFFFLSKADDIYPEGFKSIYEIPETYVEMFQKVVMIYKLFGVQERVKDKFKVLSQDFMSLGFKLNHALSLM